MSRVIVTTSVPSLTHDLEGRRRVSTPKGRGELKREGGNLKERVVEHVRQNYERGWQRKIVKGDAKTTARTGSTVMLCLTHIRKGGGLKGAPGEKKAAKRELKKAGRHNVSNLKIRETKYGAGLTRRQRDQGNLRGTGPEQISVKCVNEESLGALKKKLHRERHDEL